MNNKRIQRMIREASNFRLSAACLLITGLVIIGLMAFFW